ncbi:MAG: AAA family ATPase [Pirellulales bacterium]
MPEAISIKDVGPIKELMIDPKPGVTVLVGENGAGKSKALEAVDALTAGKTKLKPRDGSLGGEVEGFGIRISVGHSNRRFGDPRFVALGEKLDVAALVEPGLKSPEANDAARIKALVGLTGVTADSAMFHELVGGQAEFERLVKKTSIALDDPVEMARRVKKDLEEAARLEQSHADHADGHAKAKLESAKQFGDNLPAVDEAALQQGFRGAVATEARLQSLAEQAKQTAIERQTAQDKLEAARKQYEGPAVGDARAELAEAERLVAAAQFAAVDAEQAFRKANEAHRSACVARDRKHDQLVEAERHAGLVAAWEKQLADTSALAAPSDEALASAAEEVRKARQAIEDSVVARKAQSLLEEAEAAAEKAKGHLVKATRLRDSAKAIESVLSKLIAKAGCKLTVVGTEKGPRLVTETDRGQTLFADLSDGQRWRMAMEIGLDTFQRMIEAEGVKGTPIFPLPQRAWQDLNPANREPIAELAKERGVCILTARCDDGPLRVEVL